MLSQVCGRTARDESDGGEPLRQRAEQLDDAGQRPGRLRVLDDGAEGTVEVQAQGTFAPAPPAVPPARGPRCRRSWRPPKRDFALLAGGQLDGLVADEDADGCGDAGSGAEPHVVRGKGDVNAVAAVGGLLFFPASKLLAFTPLLGSLFVRQPGCRS